MSPAHHPTTIGPFQIERELGRGGMGEVYLAKDTRLDRAVAIKALPAHLAQDPDRLSRFQREAKVLASLNHPNIGAIYGLEEAQGHQYLVLEFIEGETLADRLGSGAIPIEETLSIAKQMAEALEVAHEKGIIHRDLKPGNVMVTPEGVVKVLDFGLARTQEGPISSTTAPVAPDSPTLVTQPRMHSPTIPGAILGTAGYMSPEQARGKPVDKRSDNFSFGCVLYEMFTGVGPFHGESVTDSLGAILHREPDWALLPAQTPARIRELLRKCLAKDRRNRQHDIGDARLDLERTIAGHEWVSSAAPAAIKSRRSLVPVGIVCAAALLGAGWGLARWLPHAAPTMPSQPFFVSTSVPEKPAFNSLVAISPDSKFLVFTASPELPPESVKPAGILMIRRLDRDETSIIEGTEGVMDAALSPDGRWIAYACAKDRAGTKTSLKKIALENGRPSGKPETVCEFAQGGSPAVGWSSDREILFSPPWEPIIYAVSAAGGEPKAILREEMSKGIETWGGFRPLVPGQSVIASRFSVMGQKIKVNTEVIDLASAKRTVVLPNVGMTQFLPDGNGGYLVGMRDTFTTLVAVRFDIGSLRTIGEPETVWSGNPINSHSISPSGTLAMALRSADVTDRRLAWIDDKGQPQTIPGISRAFTQISVSPDGGRVLVQLEVQNQGELTNDLWVNDLNRRTFTRIPNQGALVGVVWSADGQRFACGLVTDEGFSLWERRVDGSGEPIKLFMSADKRTLVVPMSYSPDGKTLAFLQVDLATNTVRTFLLEPDGKQWVAKPYLKATGNEELSRFSPDGKWALISSSQSGRPELYVQKFTGDGEADAAAGRVQISSSGSSGSSTNAWWSADGKEIRYLDADNQVLSVHIKTDPTFVASEPKVLYSIKDLKAKGFSFAPDGRLMIVLPGESEQTTRTINLVVNFLQEVRAKMTTLK